MPRPFLIIDGYNLMHAVGMARQKYGPGDLERRRTRFLNYLLVNLEPEQLQRTTVVFDAADAPFDMPRQANLHGMTIFFADRGSDADSLIEELIVEHSAPKQIRVVSSDHRLQQAARKRRGSFVDSDDFVRELRREAQAEADAAQRLKTGPPPAKFSGELSHEETDAWMEEFGEVPEAGQLEFGGLEKLQHEIDQIVAEERKRKPGKQPSRGKRRLP